MYKIKLITFDFGIIFFSGSSNTLFSRNVTKANFSGCKNNTLYTIKYSYL